MKNKESELLKMSSAKAFSRKKILSRAPSGVLAEKKPDQEFLQ